MSDELSLGQKQALFMRLEAEWRLWVFQHPGWTLRPGESRILQLGPDGEGRRARLVSTGQIVRVRDLVHKDGGCHYMGLASDPQLFVNGEHITRTDHVAWLEAGEHWESLDPLCCWGGRFAGGDGNHISITHGGMR